MNRCVESVPFALLLNHAFPYHDFMTNTADKRVADSMRTVRIAISAQNTCTIP